MLARAGLGSACWALLAAVLLPGCAGTGRPSPSAESGAAANDSSRFPAEHDGLPLAWSRCRPITWKLNSGGVDDAVGAARCMQSGASHAGSALTHVD